MFVILDHQRLVQIKAHVQPILEESNFDDTSAKMRLSELPSCPLYVYHTYHHLHVEKQYSRQKASDLVRSYEKQNYGNTTVTMVHVYVLTYASKSCLLPLTQTVVFPCDNKTSRAMPIK